MGFDLPSPPELSPSTRRWLAEVAEQDELLWRVYGLTGREADDLWVSLDREQQVRLVVDARAYRQLLKDAAVAVSGALDWRAIAARPSHAELERRRAQPGRWPA